LTPLLDNFTYQDPAGAKAALQEVWYKALAPCAAMPHALLLRDFMPDNLMDIPARADGQTVGVLDFELAGVGPLAYDVASLTEQVRRDLPDELRQAVYAAYLRQWPELEPVGFIDSVHLLSVQRHARTFARLKLMQKPDFYIRTFSFLQQQLQHPACRSVRGWFTRFMPDYFS
jgi:aminoglycoside/choline kinase family phosphotransferase